MMTGRYTHNTCPSPSPEGLPTLQTCTLFPSPGPSGNTGKTGFWFPSMLTRHQCCSHEEHHAHTCINRAASRTSCIFRRMLCRVSLNTVSISRAGAPNLPPPNPFPAGQPCCSGMVDANPLKLLAGPTRPMAVVAGCMDVLAPQPGPVDI